MENPKNIILQKLKRIQCSTHCISGDLSVSHMCLLCSCPCLSVHVCVHCRNCPVLTSSSRWTFECFLSGSVPLRRQASTPRHRAYSTVSGPEGTGGRGLQHGMWPAETPLTVNRQEGQVLQQPHYATPSSCICTSHTSTPTHLHTGHRTQDTLSLIVHIGMHTCAELLCG